MTQAVAGQGLAAYSNEPRLQQLRGDEWLVIDQWDFRQGTVRGQFGFSLPGKDEIGLKGFALTH